MNNRTKIYLILISLLFWGEVPAQIAVNRNTAAGNALYIEGGNTAITTDDVIITDTGNVGIGGIPQNKLDINGRMIYSYGSPEKDQVLVSDPLGFASWSFMAFASKIGEWTLTNNTGTLFKNNTQTPLTGTSTIKSGDEIGLVVSTNGVTIPKGIYLMFITGSLSGNEYGSLSTNTGYRAYYGIELNGTASYLNLAVATKLTLSFNAQSPAIKKTDGTFFYLQTPYTVPYSFTVRLLKLD